MANSKAFLAYRRACRLADAAFQSASLAALYANPTAMRQDGRPEDKERFGLAIREANILKSKALDIAEVAYIRDRPT